MEAELPLKGVREVQGDEREMGESMKKPSINKEPGSRRRVMVGLEFG